MQIHRFFLYRVWLEWLRQEGILVSVISTDIVLLHLSDGVEFALELQHTDTTQWEDGKRDVRTGVTWERGIQICCCDCFTCCVLLGFSVFAFMTFVTAMTANFETSSLNCHCFVFANDLCELF